jgi:hypothetical protein
MLQLSEKWARCESIRGRDKNINLRVGSMGPHLYKQRKGGPAPGLIDPSGTCWWCGGSGGMMVDGLPDYSIGFLGWNSMAYCPKCTPGQMVDANGQINDWYPTTQRFVYENGALVFTGADYTLLPTGESAGNLSGLFSDANNFPSVRAAQRQPPGLKPGCTQKGLWAGLKAAGQDLIPVPPQFNTDPVGATGDFLTSKQGQAATIGVLYEVANGARYLAPFADAAADFVPIAGQLWLAYQVGHALYEGGVAYKEAIDQCYGGG